MDNVKMLRMMTSGNSDLLQEIRKFHDVQCIGTSNSRLRTYIHVRWDHGGILLILLVSLEKWGALSLQNNRSSAYFVIREIWGMSGKRLL